MFANVLYKLTADKCGRLDASVETTRQSTAGNGPASRKRDGQAPRETDWINGHSKISKYAHTELNFIQVDFVESLRLAPPAEEDRKERRGWRSKLPK